MKNIFKKLFLLCIFIFCLYSQVFAKEGIESIDIDIYIDEYGDATVTEIWKCEAYSGTEWYHPYYNLGNAEITDLMVSENGRKYSLLSPWNVNASQYYKTEKYGINKLSDGIEICWGMGSYGVHEYEVSYKIKNFVDNLNDSQMIYWTLIQHNRSDVVDNASIKIYADKPFDENVLVWGFGEDGGICRVLDGYIEMKSNNSLKIQEYMTILVKLPQNFFDSTNTSNKSFEYFYDMAIKDSKLEEKINRELWIHDIIFGNEFVLFIIFLTFTLLFRFGMAFLISSMENVFKKLTKNSAIAIFLAYMFLVYCFMMHNFWLIILLLVIVCVMNKNIKEHKVIKGKIKESQVLYYRDIPCEKDLFKIYYIAYQYGIIKNESDLLGALILKWIKEKKVTLLDKNEDNKKECIKLSGEYYVEKWDNIFEQQLYRMMYNASGDGILEKKELKKWCKNKYSTLFSWFKNIMQHEQSELIKSGELILSKFGSHVEYIPTQQLYEEGRKICGLKKFLREYTLISEREAIEVKIFEEYLIIAQMLGIADEVIEQFEGLYPEIINQSQFNYRDYIFVNSMARYTIRTSIRVRNIKKTMSAASSYSGGGGGRSFGGGGGGSRGGGSRGGGGRR